MAEITFNATFYYEQKLNQLKGLNEELYGDWTIADVALAFRAEGLTPEQHASKFAAVEGLSVSPDFDTPRYLQDKLAQLQSLDPELYGEWTVEDVAAAFQEAGLSPLEHFQRFGAEEGLQAFPAGYTGPAGLTEALADYQGAVAARTEFLNGNADNELLEGTAVIQGLAEGEEPTPAQVATAIEQANTAAQNAVETAEDNLQDAIDTLDVARATQFSAAGTDSALDQADIDEAVTALDSISTTTLMRDATLEAARVEAQAAVDADETVYTEDGLLASDGYTPLTLNDDGEYVVATGDAEVVGYANVVTPADAAPSDASAEGVSTLDISTVAAGFTGSLALTFTPQGGSETTVELDIENGIVTAGTTDAVTVNEAGTEITISGLAESQAASGSYAYTEASLAETFSAAELQQEIVDAEDALSAHEASKGDYAALLDSVRDAINAHIGAGGENLDISVNYGDNASDLLDLRGLIRGVVDVEDGEEVDEADAKALVEAIETAGFEIEAAEGEELTAQEKAINAAFADIEKRVELETAVTTAEENFDATATGEILNVILTLQEERQELIDNIAKAEEALAEAQADAEGTQQLVDALAALDEQIETALAFLENSEEEGGFGVTLIDFADGSDATAESDLYVFSDAKGETVSIANFGAEGEDRLFFGEGYTLVALGDDEITDRVGASDALEIFWAETETGLTLYVEADAEAGRDLGTSAITTIELAGVTAEDINDDLANGFLSVGTVVEVA